MEKKGLTNNNSSTNLFIRSFLSLFNIKKFKITDLLKFVFFFAFSLFITYCIYSSNEKVELIIKTISFINRVELVFWTISFTGYSIFCGFLKKYNIKVLLTYGPSDKSNSPLSKNYENINKILDNLHYTVINYTINIFINYILYLIFTTAPLNKLKVLLSLTNTNCVSFLFWIFILNYLFISDLILYDIKYFLFNLFTMNKINIENLEVEILNDENKSKFHEKKNSFYKMLIKIFKKNKHKL